MRCNVGPSLLGCVSARQAGVECSLLCFDSLVGARIENSEIYREFTLTFRHWHHLGLSQKRVLVQSCRRVGCQGGVSSFHCKSSTRTPERSSRCGDVAVVRTAKPKAPLPRVVHMIAKGDRRLLPFIRDMALAFLRELGRSLSSETPPVKILFRHCPRASDRIPLLVSTLLCIADCQLGAVAPHIKRRKFNVLLPSPALFRAPGDHVFAQSSCLSCGCIATLPTFPTASLPALNWPSTAAPVICCGLLCYLRSLAYLQIHFLPSFLLRSPIVYIFLVLSPHSS